MTSLRSLTACLAVSVALSACAGYTTGRNDLPTVDGASSALPAALKSSSSVDENALAAMDANMFGLKVLIDEARSDSPPSTGNTKGACKNGVEVYIPDRAGNANSQEFLEFYDVQCTSLARDTVRRFTPLSPGSESVQLQIADYTPGAKKPNGLRSTKDTFSKGTFDKNGYPIISAGFVRQGRVALSTGAGQKLYTYADEYILAPKMANGTALCGDDTGYTQKKLSGFAREIGSLGIFSGTRTNEPRGATIQSAYTDGAAYAAQSFSFVRAKSNLVCPVSKPAYKLTPGTRLGITAGVYEVDFTNGTMTAVAANIALNGYISYVLSDPKTFPNDPTFVQGRVQYGGQNVATMSVNQFGDGTFTVKNTGKTYSVVDWIPVNT